jgi:hypothetical protein
MRNLNFSSNLGFIIIIFGILYSPQKEGKTAKVFKVYVIQNEVTFDDHICSFRIKTFYFAQLLKLIMRLICLFSHNAVFKLVLSALSGNLFYIPLSAILIFLILLALHKSKGSKHPAL